MASDYRQSTVSSSGNKETLKPKTPTHIPVDKLYKLRPGETTLYSSSVEPPRWFGESPNYTFADLKADPKARKLLMMMLDEALTIQSSPKIYKYGSMFEEAVGLYTNVRVLPLRNCVTGKMEKGWILVGVPKINQ